MVNIGFDRCFGNFSKGNQSLFISLANNPEETGREITTVYGQGYQFRYPQSCRVEEEEHCIITDCQRITSLRCDEKPVDLVNGECFGQRPATFGKVDC